MSLKKKYNHGAEHKRSLKALHKTGLSGILITGDDKNILTSLIGGKGKSMTTVHLAMLQTDYLRLIAETVTNYVLEQRAKTAGLKTETTEDLTGQ